MNKQAIEQQELQDAYSNQKKLLEQEQKEADRKMAEDHANRQRL